MLAQPRSVLALNVYVYTAVSEPPTTVTTFVPPVAATHSPTVCRCVQADLSLFAEVDVVTCDLLLCK